MSTSDEGPSHDDVERRRQVVRLTVESRPGITLPTLHEVMSDVWAPVDDDVLRGDLDAIGCEVAEVDGEQVVHPVVEAGAAEGAGDPGAAGATEPVAEALRPTGGTSAGDEVLTPSDGFDWPEERNSKAMVIGVAAVAVVILLIGLGLAVFGGGGDDSSSTTTTAGTSPRTDGQAAGTTAPALPLGGLALTGKGAKGVVGASSFDEPVADGLGTIGGKPWDIIGGGWAVADGQARLTRRAGPVEASLAVVPEPSSGVRVQATLPTITKGAGLVVRVRDAKNYWLLAASPGYSTLALSHVTDGKSTQIADAGVISLKPGMRIGVWALGDKIYGFANDKAVLVASDGDYKPGTGFGLGAERDVSAAAWDNFVYSTKSI